jgi:hypothetical protein
MPVMAGESSATGNFSTLVEPSTITELSPEPKLEGEEGETMTSRLLAAKKRASQERNEEK